MSALRINLLPAYIAEVQRTKVAIIAVVVVLAVALAASFVVYTGLKSATETREAEASDMTQKATDKTSEVTKIKGEATTLRAQIAPIQDRVTFVKQVRFYNTWVEKIYRRAARYTDARVEYSSMAVTGGSLAMNGYAHNVDDLARYLITFYGNPDVTAVSVSGPPGWARPEQTINSNPLADQAGPKSTGFYFGVNATLLKALTLPQPPASLSGELTPTTPGGAPAKSASPPANGG